jgi:hypothetical protein
MKKILLVVVAVVVIGGLLTAKMMYDKKLSKERIAKLATFKLPEDFRLLLTRQNLMDVKAPLYDFRMMGDVILPEMIELLRNTAAGESERCAAIIVMGHLTKGDAIDDVVAQLYVTDSRLGECAAVFLQLFYQKVVPDKIKKVALDKKADAKVKLQAYQAMQMWAARKLKASASLKRRRSGSLKALALKGLEEKDLALRKIAVEMLPNISFDADAEEGEVAEVNRVVDIAIPFLQHKDKDLVEKTFASLKFLIGEMMHTTDALGSILPLAKVEDKDLRLKATLLLQMIYKDEESSLRKEMEKVHFLLEDSEKEILLVAIDMMTKFGRTVEDRLALKLLTENEDKEIAEAAKAAQLAIMKAEKE